MTAKNEPLTIPVTHLPVLINSAIAESMLQTERRLTPEGAFQWRWRDGEGSVNTEWSAWGDSPPLDFFGDANLAFRLAAKFCAQNRLTVEVQIAQNGNWAARLGKINEDGSAEIVGRPALMETPQAAVCMALLSVAQVDLAARHRDLFPGHYIVQH